MEADAGSKWAVFVVGCPDTGAVWQQLSEAPPFSDGPVDKSGKSVVRAESKLLASAQRDECVLERGASSRLKRLMGRCSRRRLRHGDSFDHAGCKYLVYVERAGMAWGSLPSPSTAASDAAITALSKMPAEELNTAARRFLELPYVCGSWYAEFLRSTGFRQLRDGNVPRVRSCEVARTPPGVELRCDIFIWSMFRLVWCDLREHLALSRTVSGEDLVRFAECAFLFRDIPICEPVPAVDSPFRQPTARLPERPE